MCCFTQPVKSVGATSIIARMGVGAEQYIAYAMSRENAETSHGWCGACREETRKAPHLKLPAKAVMLTALKGASRKDGGSEIAWTW